MRFTTTLALTTLSLTFVGCSQLSRGGAAAMNFDENPFLQSSDQQDASNANAQLPPAQPSAVAQGFDPDQGQTAQYQYNPQQAQPTTQGANVAWQFDLSAGNGQGQQVTAPSVARPPSGPGGPAARAEAQVAEYLARKHAPGNSEIEQVVHQVPSTETAGTARLDLGSGGPELFEPNPFAGEPNSGVVHAQHQTEADSNQMPMLSADDLTVDAARPKTAPQSPHVFPGTSIPIPTGRAMLFNDEMLGQPTPPTTQNQTANPQPDFTPPTTHVQPGQVPKPVVGEAIPLLRTSEPGTATATPQRTTQSKPPATAEPTARPVIRDSRSDSKWRATRRM